MNQITDEDEYVNHLEICDFAALAQSLDITEGQLDMILTKPSRVDIGTYDLACNVCWINDERYLIPIGRLINVNTAFKDRLMTGIFVPNDDCPFTQEQVEEGHFRVVVKKAVEQRLTPTYRETITYSAVVYWKP